MSSREDFAFDAVVRRIAAGDSIDMPSSDPLAPLRPAPPAVVATTEALLGRPLPSLLRRLYLEVGNGGFGPGYGLLGLPDGDRTGSINALSRLNRSVLTLCYWGCGISSELDLVNDRVWGCDPNPAPNGVSCRFPQHITVADWFVKWTEGTLHQPWLVRDPTTGVWRGATDAEYAEVLAESLGFGGPVD